MYAAPGTGLQGARDRKIEASVRMHKPLSDLGNKQRDEAHRLNVLQAAKDRAALNRARFAAIAAAKVRHEADNPVVPDDDYGFGPVVDMDL